jgi:hypothetical protein
MSEPHRMSAEDFVQELTRLTHARLAATDSNERLMLDTQIADLIRAHVEGRSGTRGTR